MIDAYNDPYQERSIGLQRRKEFEKLKRSNGFPHWRNRQEKIQSGRCAWCRYKLKYVVVHVDHVTPLRFGGTNDYDNLVLSCRRCNIKKYIANNRTVPGWIKENAKKHKAKQKIQSYRRSQYIQARDLMDDMIYDELRWIV